MVTVTPTASGTVTVDVAAGAAEDSAGNPSAVADQFSIPADTVAPTVTITTDASGPVNGPFAAAVTFSEPVTGFELAESVKADGGVLQHYTKLSGIPVTEEDVGFFQVFSSAALAAPILDAVRRGLDGEAKNFLSTYMLQPLVSAQPGYCMILGYPEAEE